MEDAKKVILYPRVSSVQQLKGDSIEAQEMRLRKFCEDKGFEVVGVYTDAGKSASISDDKIKVSISDKEMTVKFNLSKRPAFKRMLEDAKNNIFEAIIFFRWDRFGRSAIFSKSAQIYFNKMGIELIPSDDNSDPLVVAIKGALDEDEVRKIKERVRLVRLKRFKEGVMVGRSPIGYRWSKTKKKMVIDKKKAEMVCDVFLMASEGKSYKEICKKHDLKPQSYYNILRNHVYTGVIEFESEVREGVHEKIIEERLFKKVNYEFADGKEKEGEE